MLWAEGPGRGVHGAARNLRDWGWFKQASSVPFSANWVRVHISHKKRQWDESLLIQLFQEREMPIPDTEGLLFT